MGAGKFNSIQPVEGKVEYQWPEWEFNSRCKIHIGGLLTMLWISVPLRQTFSEEWGIVISLGSPYNKK